MYFSLTNNTNHPPPPPKMKILVFAMALVLSMSSTGIGKAFYQASTRSMIAEEQKSHDHYFIHEVLTYLRS
jgi:hypothetical protein